MLVIGKCVTLFRPINLSSKKLSIYNQNDSCKSAVKHTFRISLLVDVFLLSPGQEMLTEAQELIVNKLVRKVINKAKMALIHGLVSYC